MKKSLNKGAIQNYVGVLDAPQRAVILNNRKDYLGTSPKYFFILGRNPTLSFAELTSVLTSQALSYHIDSLSREVVIVAADDELDTDQLMHTLGGIVKIGTIVASLGWDQSEEEFERVLSVSSLKTHFFQKSSGKIRFGISVYDGGGDNSYLKLLSQKLKDWNMLVKENLKNAGLSSGFVRVDNRKIPSATVAKERLITKGAEIVFVVTKDALLVGATRYVQAFEQFALRDVGKPGKDKRSGIMPPKLARMMINIAGKSTSEILLDPFCGSGTIVLEALTLGFKHIIATDSSDKAIADTQKNIRWLTSRQREIATLESGIRVLKADVRNLSQFVLPASVDAIVTEPFLGPPLFSDVKQSAINRIMSELQRLYIIAFAQFGRVLKPHGRVVIIFPVFPYGRSLHFIEIFDEITRMGFVRYNMIPSEYISQSTRELTSRNTILFGGNFQFLQREILAFQKN